MTGATLRAKLGRWPATTLAAAVCVIALSAGFLLKECTALREVWKLSGVLPRLYTWSARAQMGHLLVCHSDIRNLYSERGIISEGTFPYVHGRLKRDGDFRGDVEYPVLTGLFMWMSGRLASNADQYYRINALLLAPIGLFVGYLLDRLVGPRALLWAAAPALTLYAFHNWDLLVVAATVSGIWFWTRGRPGWAGLFFGIGAALKMYPLLLLAPLVLESWSTGDRPGAAAGAGAGIAAVALVNLPFILLNFAGWFAPYEFHRLRGPNYDTIWNLVLPVMSTKVLNLLTAGLVGISCFFALLFGSLRARKEHIFPFVQVCSAMVAGFLLWNKIHSPQYALWLLPFLALTSVSVVWWVGYSLIDILLYVGIFVVGRINLDLIKPALVFAVSARAVLLLGLWFAFLRSRAVHRERETLPKTVLA